MDKNFELSISDARIALRNFSGKEGKYNPPGRRSFAVLLDEHTAARLAADGWSIKFFKPRDPEEEPQAFLSVRVNFENIAPEIYLVNSQNKQRLDVENVNLLDFADLINVDLVIRPYMWEVNGKTGVKAYLKKGFFTIREDEFSAKYRDLPVVGND